MSIHLLRTCSYRSTMCTRDEVPDCRSLAARLPAHRKDDALSTMSRVMAQSRKGARVADAHSAVIPATGPTASFIRLSWKYMPQRRPQPKNLVHNISVPQGISDPAAHFPSLSYICEPSRRPAVCTGSDCIPEGLRSWELPLQAAGS